MATFNLVVTYPDAEGPRIMAALKTHWTENGVVPSNAEVVEKLRLVVAANVKDLVLRVEREAAIEAAAAAVTPVTVG
jgi:hypothetical protein